MDFRVQDVVRCDVCDNNIVEMYCDICFVNLCKVCVGEYMFDEFIDYKIVKFNFRKIIIFYFFCLEYFKK